jgi:hypothetical protein
VYQEAQEFLDSNFAVLVVNLRETLFTECIFKASPATSEVKEDNWLSQSLRIAHNSKIFELSYLILKEVFSESKQRYRKKLDYFFHN